MHLRLSNSKTQCCTPNTSRLLSTHTPISGQAWHTKQQISKTHHSHTCNNIHWYTYRKPSIGQLHTHTAVESAPVVLWPCSLCEGVMRSIQAFLHINCYWLTHRDTQCSQSVMYGHQCDGKHRLTLPSTAEPHEVRIFLLNKPRMILLHWTYSQWKKW